MVQPFRSISETPEPLGHVFCGGDGDYGGDMWRVEEEGEEGEVEEEEEVVVEKEGGEHDNRGLCWSIGCEGQRKEEVEEEDEQEGVRMVGRGADDDVILGLELQQDSVSLYTDTYVHSQQYSLPSLAVIVGT